jgi:ribosomal protein L11 methylase PrmA
LLARVRSGGVLLLSGIIEDRWPQVEAALRLAGCGDARVSRQDGWLAVQVVRG